MYTCTCTYTYIHVDITVSTGPIMQPCLQSPDAVKLCLQSPDAIRQLDVQPTHAERERKKCHSFTYYTGIMLGSSGLVLVFL